MSGKGQGICCVCDEAITGNMVGAGDGSGTGADGHFAHPECCALREAQVEFMCPELVVAVAKFGRKILANAVFQASVDRQIAAREARTADQQFAETGEAKPVPGSLVDASMEDPAVKTVTTIRKLVQCCHSQLALRGYVVTLCREVERLLCDKRETRDKLDDMGAKFHAALTVSRERNAELENELADAKANADGARETIAKLEREIVEADREMPPGSYSSLAAAIAIMKKDHARELEGATASHATAILGQRAAHEEALFHIRCALDARNNESAMDAAKRTARELADSKADRDKAFEQAAASNNAHAEQANRLIAMARTELADANTKNGELLDSLREVNDRVEMLTDSLGDIGNAAPLSVPGRPDATWHEFAKWLQSQARDAAIRRVWTDRRAITIRTLTAERDDARWMAEEAWRWVLASRKDWTDAKEALEELAIDFQELNAVLERRRVEIVRMMSERDDAKRYVAALVKLFAAKESALADGEKGGAK